MPPWPKRRPTIGFSPKTKPITSPQHSPPLAPPGCASAGETDATAILYRLIARWPHLDIVLTLGAEGAIFAHGTTRLHQPALPVAVVDTTAAGDTFLGYLLASLIAGLPMPNALARATRAAALAIARPGAADSIPRASEITD